MSNEWPLRPDNISPLAKIAVATVWPVTIMIYKSVPGWLLWREFLFLKKHEAEMEIEQYQYDR